MLTYVFMVYYTYLFCFVSNSVKKDRLKYLNILRVLLRRCLLLLTVSAHIERQRSIKIYDFQIVHNSLFWPVFVQEYLDFGQKAVKNDQGVLKLSFMALYMRGYGILN